MEKYRLAVYKNLDYYLMPLSNVQLKWKLRKELIDNNTEESYEQVFKEKQGKKVLVAEGFEVKEDIEIHTEDGVYQWKN